MSIRRALALVVSLLAVWVGLAQPSAATATTSSAAVTTYTYDGHHHGAALTHTATERGPPVAAYNPNVTGVDGYEPTGTSVRPEVATDQTHTAYDLPVQLAPVALSTPTTQVDVRRTDGDLWSFQRRHVAAKSADELAHLGQGWRATSFGDEAASFEFHFGKHGVEAGVTREQYAQDALNWARNPAGTGKSIQLKDGTGGLRYRTPGGGPGGITDLDGNIITFWYR